ncbi:hypothetical protein B9Z55_021505 [Caenorhabditis nigoni]|uniref:Uncharacterized protein n=1 Tax=Caenorhabditis nigoni TaxID=1611254 RepID=A0A2G5TT58_9PELO|nr:hypothetical protein B9Z55_021505 [Caenorhabditis nigoni]
MESAVSSVFRSLGSALRLQLPTASPSPMSRSTSRVIVSDANPLDDVPMEDATGPVVPAVVAPAKDIHLFYGRSNPYKKSKYSIVTALIGYYSVVDVAQRRRLTFPLNNTHIDYVPENRSNKKEGNVTIKPKINTAEVVTQIFEHLSTLTAQGSRIEHRLHHMVLNNKRPSTEPGDSHQKKRKMLCSFCASLHDSKLCDVYTDSTQRWAQVAKQGLCHCCLMGKHQPQSCGKKNRKCPVCKENHHLALCFTATEHHD